MVDGGGAGHPPRGLVDQSNISTSSHPASISRQRAHPFVPAIFSQTSVVTHAYVICILPPVHVDLFLFCFFALNFLIIATQAYFSSIAHHAQDIKKHVFVFILSDWFFGYYFHVGYVGERNRRLNTI